MQILKSKILKIGITVLLIFVVIETNCVHGSTGLYSKNADGDTKTILLNVPFTTQAPLGGWSDPRQQDGCEEASALMAVSWARGKKLSKQEALKQIIAIADFENKKFMNFHDTSAKDTVARIIKGFFNYKKVSVKYSPVAEDIRIEIAKGHAVIVPTNGRKLGNPNYKRPGPEHHNLVIKGYDPKTKEFITNDPGTRKGEGYRYKETVLMNAIIDYPTGNHSQAKNNGKAMIVVWK